MQRARIRFLTLPVARWLGRPVLSRDRLIFSFQCNNRVKNSSVESIFSLSEPIKLLYFVPTSSVRSQRLPRVSKGPVMRLT